MVEFEFTGYEIFRELNRGGMARVYLAKQIGLDRNVALKVMSPELFAIPGFKDRFLREAKTVANLNHPNIVSIFEVREEDGQLFISMGLAEGGDLKQKIKDGLTVDEALEIVKDVASALAYAHRADIVHRDIKPENVLFSEEGQVLLTDFGIAKMLDNESDQLTQAGLSLGTPAFMPPEQFTGEPVDGRSDLYALGAMLFQMLTGEQPYSANTTAEWVYRHVHSPIPELPENLSIYQKLIDKLMAKNPDDRFATGDEVVDMIDAYLEDSSADTIIALHIENETAVHKPLVSEGDIHDVFICHDPDDIDVFKEIRWLQSQGINVWYDVEKGSGSEWSESLQEKIRKCRYFVYFVTPRSVKNENCRLELAFAQREGLSIVTVELETTEIPAELHSTLSRHPDIKKNELDETVYREAILQALSASPTSLHATPQRGLTRNGLIALACLFVVGVSGYILFIEGYSNDLKEGSAESLAEQSSLDAGGSDVSATGGISEKKYRALRSLAVLPFVHFEEGQQLSLLDGQFGGDLLDQVSSVGQIGVASRSASYALAKEGRSAEEIGRQLNVGYVLEGSIAGKDNGHRLTAQLIRIEDGRQIWSGSWNENLNDQSAYETLVNRLSYRIEHEVGGDWWRRSGWRFSDDYKDADPEAVAVNFKGDKILVDSLFDELPTNFSAVEKFMQQAIEIDPDFYVPYETLLYIYNGRLGGELTPDEASERAHKVAQILLEERPDSFHLYLQLAQLYVFVELDFVKALEAVEKMREIEPSTNSHIGILMDIALNEGRKSEAARLARQLAQTSEGTFNRAGGLSESAFAFLALSEYDLALEQANAALDITTGEDRAFVLRVKAAALIYSGRGSESQRYLDEAWEIERWTYPEPHAWFHAVLGREEEAKKLLADADPNPNNYGELAEAHLALGDRERGFELLRLAIEDRSRWIISTLRIAPFWDRYRNDPRFDDLLNLMDSQIQHTDRFEKRSSQSRFH